MLQNLINKVTGKSNLKEKNNSDLRIYNAARVYVGTISGCGQWGDDWEEESKFIVVSGEVKAKKLRPFVLSGDLSGTFKTFVLYPVTQEAKIEVLKNAAAATTEIITLHKYEGIGKSTMYKQRL